MSLDKVTPDQYIHGRRVEVGAIYRHFKGGLYKVLAVAEDTENRGSFSVVYEDIEGENKGKVWHRPLSMFLSKIDFEKFHADQGWRFQREQPAEKTGWRYIEEELDAETQEIMVYNIPEEGEEVIVQDLRGNVYIDMLLYDSDGYYWDGGAGWDEITAWMPKPKPEPKPE